MPPVGSYVRALSTMSDRRTSGDDSPVVEADRQLRAEMDAALDSLDDAHDVGRLAARRHEVEDTRDRAVLRLPDRLEDERVVEIATRARGGRRRREEPAPVVGV